MCADRARPKLVEWAEVDVYVLCSVRRGPSDTTLKVFRRERGSFARLGSSDLLSVNDITHLGVPFEIARDLYESMHDEAGIPTYTVPVRRAIAAPGDPARAWTVFQGLPVRAECPAAERCGYVYFRQDVTDRTGNTGGEKFVKATVASPVRYTFLTGGGGAISVQELVARGVPRSVACSPGWNLCNQTPYDAGKGFDLSDPVQVVEKYYALWDNHRFPDTYAMLSDRYRHAHPYAGWLASHDTVNGIRIRATPGTTPSTVLLTIVSYDRTPSGVKESAYDGNWVLVRQHGAWKLDVPNLRQTKPPS